MIYFAFYDKDCLVLKLSKKVAFFAREKMATSELLEELFLSKQSLCVYIKCHHSKTDQQAKIYFLKLNKEKVMIFVLNIVFAFQGKVKVAQTVMCSNAVRIWAFDYKV